jgi:hypothetical protein
MKDDVQKDWDSIDEETERVFRKPRAETREQRARDAWEKMFRPKPRENRHLD